jgi:hypothetical protein
MDRAALERVADILLTNEKYSSETRSNIARNNIKTPLAEIHPAVLPA